MRPVRLVAEGFAAFRDRVVLDFEDVDFFALVGPTGSGKSSVIDAICFALYGCVPRYEDRRVVAPAITTGASEAKVSLVFDVAGERYQATRVVRRQLRGAGASTREARLERFGPAAHAAAEPLETTAGSAEQLDSAVERLLGLDFDQFTRCVVLPQGEFARFLHDKPAARQALLTRLLDLEVYPRMGQRARALAAEAESALAVKAERLGALGTATPEALAAAQRRTVELRALADRLRDAEPAIERLDREAAAELESAAKAESAAAALGAIAVPATVVDSAQHLQALEHALTEAEAVLATTEARRLALEGAVAELPDLAPLLAALDAHDELDRLSLDLAAALERLEAAQAAMSAADLASAESAAAEHEADAALAAARLEHAAADLAGHLNVGRPCPVCRATVTAIPSVAAPPELAAGEQRRTVARRAAEAARAASTRAAAELAAAQEQGASLVVRQQRLAERVGQHEDRSVVAATIEAAKARHDELAAVRGEEERARRRRDDATATVGQARNALNRAVAIFNAQRDPIVHLAPPVPGGSDLLADWRELADWAQSEEPKQRNMAFESHEAAARSAAARDELLQSLRAACDELGAAPGGALPSGRPCSIGDLRAGVAGALGAAEMEAAAMEAAIAEAAQVREQIADLEERAEVAEALGSLLTARGFERWLIREALDVLVEGASETMRRLSGGQYSLVCDDHNEFLVVDHRNADERRLAKTLSGGETFQASLALALALSDQLASLAAGGAAKLESIFLDEGFGTLDPEALAVVADTVEALGSDERLVGIVTHVRELAERVPVRFEVAKNARTSTIERRTA